VSLAEQALVLAAVLSLPFLAIAAVVGLFFAGFETLTGLGDSTLAHLGRFAAVSIGLLVGGAFVAHSIVNFAARAFGAG
jgi:type III secretory pathway component EscS